MKTRSRLSARRAFAARVGAELEVFPHGEAGEDLAAFGHVDHAELYHPVAGQAVDPLALKAHLAAARPQETGDRAQHRRLASTVGAHHRQRLAGLDDHVHAA